MFIDARIHAMMVPSRNICTPYHICFIASFIKCLIFSSLAKGYHLQYEDVNVEIVLCHYQNEMIREKIMIAMRMILWICYKILI